MKIQGTVALVTGGARGIGRAVVETLLEKGAKFVSIVDCDETSGTTFVVELNKKYSEDRAKFFKCDVTNKEQLKDVFTTTQSIHNRLDIVCNNAGVEQNPDIQKLIQINLIGVFVGTEIAQELMMKHTDPSGGVIINTASLAGIYPSYIAPHYSASKAGVIAYTRAMSEHPLYKEANIRVNCVCPAFVETSLADRARAQIYSPELKMATDLSNPVPMSDVMKAFLMAIEEDTLNGQTIRVSVGMGVDLQTFESTAEAMEMLKVLKSE